MRDDLLLHRHQPGVRLDIGLGSKGRITQLLRVGDRRQRGKEVHAGAEVAERQAGIGLDRHRHIGIDEDSQWTKLGQRQADAKAAHRQFQGALQAEEEYPVCHRRGGIDGRDHVAIGIQLENTAEQPGRNLASEHLSFNHHRNGRDIDDRELAVQQQAKIDLDPVNTAADLNRQAIQSRHRSRHYQDEVLGTVVHILPQQAELGDLDRQEGRHAQT